MEKFEVVGKVEVKETRKEEVEGEVEVEGVHMKKQLQHCALLRVICILQLKFPVTPIYPSVLGLAL